MESRTPALHRGERASFAFSSPRKDERRLSLAGKLPQAPGFPQEGNEHSPPRRHTHTYTAATTAYGSFPRTRWTSTPIIRSHVAGDDGRDSSTLPKGRSLPSLGRFSTQRKTPAQTPGSGRVGETERKVSPQASRRHFSTGESGRGTRRTPEDGGRAGEEALSRPPG